MNFWYNIWPFGIDCGHLVYFSRFGMFGSRKIWQPCFWQFFAFQRKVNGSSRAKVDSLQWKKTLPGTKTADTENAVIRSRTMILLAGDSCCISTKCISKRFLKILN
jgi:hypothetical protein